MPLVASFDPDAPAEAVAQPSETEAALREAAFQLYFRFLTNGGHIPIDEGWARERFAKLKPGSIEHWLADADVCFRIYKRLRHG